MEMTPDFIIQATIFGVFMGVGIAIFLRSPEAYLAPVLIAALGTFTYFDFRDESLLKALATSAPLLCDGAQYNDYEVKDGFVVIGKKAFSIKRGECSSIVATEHQN